MDNDYQLLETSDILLSHSTTPQVMIGSQLPTSVTIDMLSNILKDRKPAQQNFTPVQENSLQYYGGYVTRLYFNRHRCEICKNALNSTEDLSKIMSIGQVFTAFKSYSPNQKDLYSNLKLCSRNFYTFIQFLEKTFYDLLTKRVYFRT